MIAVPLEQEADIRGAVIVERRDAMVNADILRNSVYRSGVQAALSKRQLIVERF